MSQTSILLNVTGPGRADPPVVRWLGAAQARSRIAILNGHAERWDGGSSGGAFSLKWAPRGRIRYRSEGATHQVTPGGFLLLNAGQPYEMSFQEAGESFCLFFSDDLVREAWGREAPEEFPTLIFRPEFARRLAELRAELSPDRAWPDDLEARLLLVLDGAVRAAKAHRGQAARLDAVKPATRRRRLAQLELARALICDGEAGALDQVARAAGLSKFHLVRLFNRAFGTTPMKYAEGVRLDRAAERLRAGAQLVDEIAFQAGYESPSAFGRAFRRRFATSPSAYRAIARN